MFADHICLFTPSFVVGFQDLLNKYYKYAQSHKMLFDCINHLACYLHQRISIFPKLLVDNLEISFVHSLKYLGIHLSLI